MGSFVPMVIVPVFVPVAAGVPVTVNVEDAPATIGLAGVNVPTANPATPVKEVTVNGEVPAFLIVKVNAVAAVPTTEEPTEIAGVLFVAIEVVPFNTCKAGAVPVTLTLSTNEGVVGSFVTIVMVPVLVPVMAGVPVTVNVAVTPAATEPGVVIALTTNPVEPVTDVSVKVAVPVFLIENDVYAVAAVPVFEDPTEIAGVLLVDTAVVLFNTCNAGTVFPVTLTFSLNEGVVGSLLAMVTVPVFAPVVAGVPVTVNVADPPTAIAPAGVIVETTKPVEPVTELIVNGEVPVLLIVNVTGLAAIPGNAEPTEIAGVLLLATGVVPFIICIAGAVPVTLTFSLNEGVVGSFVTIVIVPVFAPVAAGVPVTVNVAVDPTGTGLTGASAVTVNPVVGLIDVTVNGAEPVLLMVNVNGVAAVLISDDPTEIAGLLFVATGVVLFNTLSEGAVPVTLMFILNEGVVGSFVTIVIVPAFAPTAAGVPVTVNVADVPAATGLTGVRAVTVKPVEGVIDDTFSGAAPVLLIVNVNGVAAVLISEVPTEIAGVLLVATGVVPFNTLSVGTVPVTDIFILKEGVVGSFVKMVIDPVFTPLAAGVPVTVKVADVPAATGLTGVSAVTVNPVVGVMDVTVNGAVPVFLIVKVYAGVAAVPVGAAPIEIAGVLFVARATVPFNTLIVGALAVSDKYILYGFFSGSLFKMVNVPVRMPLVVGVNVNVNIVDEFAPTGLTV